MQERTFVFEGPAGPHTVALLCRQPPEAQEGRSLTWQLDASGGGDASAAAGSGPDLIGLDIWPAAIALCTYLAANPDLVSGHVVCELGAGMGLVGLLCASLGASQVLLTDYEPAVLSHVPHNAALNGLAGCCASRRLDWHRPGEGLAPEQRGTWRRVVAADVLYCTAIAAPLAATLRMLLHPEGVALVGHQIRRAIVLDRATRLPKLEDHDEPLEAFKAACTAAGLQLRLLGSRATCSAVDTAPMVLLAVGGGAAALEGLPPPRGDDVQ